MKVVIYGSNGMLGPHVVKALEGRVDFAIDGFGAVRNIA